jgi:hypothetical protein
VSARIYGCRVALVRSNSSLQFVELINDSFDCELHILRSHVGRIGSGWQFTGREFNQVDLPAYCIAGLSYDGTFSRKHRTRGQSKNNGRGQGLSSTGAEGTCPVPWCREARAEEELTCAD